MRVPGIPLRFAGLAIVLVLAAPTQISAQDRDQQIRQAQAHYDDFETARALTLLESALVPEEGPRDSLWAHGVHLLAQIHMEEGDEDVARSWLRWARRLVNDMPLDELVFLPEVLAASQAARAYVLAVPDPTGNVVATSWRWTTGSVSEGEGRLQVRSADPDATLTVSVGNRPSVPLGSEVGLATGSYVVTARADGQPSVRLEREVLPGVTTVVTFNLAPVVVAAEPPLVVPPPVEAEPEERQPAAPPTVRRDEGGGFPILAIVGGAAAVGVGAFLLLGSSSSGNGGVTCWDGSTASSQDQCPSRPATTGGITISVPNRSIIGRRRP